MSTTPVTTTQYGSYIDLQKHLSNEAPETSGSIYLSGSDAQEKIFMGTDLSVPNLQITGAGNWALNASKEITAILDEDNMASDSASALATQQSIKAYVDSSILDIDIDGFTDGTAATLADTDKILFSDGGTEKKANMSQVATYVYGETASSIDIDGGTIDGATIGGSSAGAGTFTTLVANGNVDLGDATSDTVTVTGRFDSDLVPSSDSARDLGTSALQWADAHIDAGYIDAVTSTTVTATNVDGILGANTAAAATVTTLKSGIVSGSSSAHFVGALTAGTLATSGSIVAKTTVSGSGAGTFGTLAARTLDIDSFSDNWTNASRTVADMGIVTTMDLNGGTIDGVTIGATSAGAGTFAALVGTSLSVSDGNITNVGTLEVDTVQSDASNTGLNINFDGDTGTNLISMQGSLASALDIKQAGGDSYLKFLTNNGYMEAGKEMAFTDGLSLAASKTFAFGNDSSSPDAHFKVASSQLMISGGVNSTNSIGLTGSVAVTAGMTVTGDFEVSAGHISGSGVVEGGTAEFRTLNIDSFAANWTNASRTVADLGIVTTVDINGGTLDGVTIGASSAAAGTFAALVGTSLSVSDGNITNVGVLETDTVQSDASNTGLNINFDGDTGTNLISMGASLASALDIKQAGGDSYLKFLTNNQYMEAGKEMAFTAGASIGENQSLSFGNDSSDPDAKLEVSLNYLIMSGTSAGKGMAVTGSMRFTSGSYLAIGYEDPQFALHLPNVAGAQGRVKANAFVTYSDKRLKKDIRPIENALDKVMKMEGVAYNWKNDNSEAIGFIAQDLEAVVPEVVVYDGNGGAGVDYAKLTSVLVEAVKAQQAELADLKKRLQ